MVEKRGRPALNGERYESGRLREPAGAERGDNLYQRFRDLESLGLDPRLTSQIGRLRCLRLLTDTQAAAADKIGRVYGRYERLHGVKRSTRSPSYEFGTGGGLDRDHDPEHVAETEADYARLQANIPILPREARATIEALCVEDRAVATWLLPDVRIVLERVADEFGLGEGERGARATGRRPLRFVGQSAAAISPLAPTRTRKPDRPKKEPKATREEKFEAGAYAAHTEDATPVASCHHAPGSDGERDHAALVRRLQEAQRRRESEAEDVATS